MNKIVSDFLDSQKEIERKKYEDEKEQLLVELDLYEKLYSPDGNYSNEYFFQEWDESNKKCKYFKKIPLNISDEEYEVLKKYSNKKEKNGIVTILTVIAWVIYVSGFILGIILAANSYEGSFLLLMGCWIGTFVSGTMYLGFAEIIKLLIDIKNK